MERRSSLSKQMRDPLRLVLERNDGDEGLVLFLAGELDSTVYESVKGVVLTHADVAARVVDGATLTDDDVAGLHGLFTEFLDTKTLALRLAAVLGTGLTFLMCHNVVLLRIKR